MLPARAPSHELKYAFPGAAADALRAWLDATCRPDPEYRRGRIASLYFDTTAFDHYDQKRASDFHKRKIRLRWYEEGIGGEALVVPAYLEVKDREGAVRRKRRIRLEVPAPDLLRRPFDSALVAALPARLLERNVWSARPLWPVAVVRYHRLRYVDPEGGARVSLDTEIEGTANPRLFPVPGPVHLDAGVLEVKGAGRDLPRLLRPMLGLMGREAFSKYARCLELLDRPMGALL